MVHRIRNNWLIAWLAAILIPIFLGTVVLVFVGSEVLRPKEIEFVVPAGFRGPFVIVFDPNGVPGDFVNGKLTVHVPASKIVRMRKMSAFSQMTYRSARFEDGAPLAVETEFEPDRVLLRFGGGADGNQFPPHDGYFVGTESELLKSDFRTIFENAGMVRDKRS